MINIQEEKKYKIISWTVTIVTLALVIVFLLACGLKSQIPPPPPKKTFYVDIVSVGGGGGGGVETPARSRARLSSGQQYATQNAQDAPSVHTSKNHSTNNAPTAPAKPQLNPNATYHGHGGTGSGGGSGSGIGSGTGSGLGPGTGSGSGGGIGFGTGARGMINSINVNVSEAGQVSVEVHVSADGEVLDARVINTSRFKTTITNATIQQQCVAKAKQARYKRGKEEIRVIVFSGR